MFKRRKNIDQVTIDDITKSLLTQLYNSSQFYKEQHTYHLNYKKKNKFLSDRLNDIINEILANLDNNIYTFKYQIYGESTLQPSFEFLTRDGLKKNMNFVQNINNNKYTKTPFGIRLDFIDTEAFRISYIIIIE